MSRSPELSQWRTQIAQHFPHLSQPMVMGLALWSLGMILVRSCSLTAIADWWSCQLGQPFQTVRERLRVTYREAEAKAGAHRAELDLSPRWAPWLAWVLEGWSGTALAVALDATTLGQRFVLLAISVVYGAVPSRSCGRCCPPAAKHPLEARMAGLVERVARPGAADLDGDRARRSGLVRQVVVRGQPAPGLAPAVARQCGGHVPARGWVHRYPLTHWTPTVGSRWQGRGTAFGGKKTRLDCTLLADWGEGRSGPLADPDRPATPRRRGLLVWVESLDRTRVQTDQTRRLAMAVYADDGPGPR